MNRRHLLQTIAAGTLGDALLPAQQRTASPGKSHIRPGLVAYSYRKPLAAKTMDYETLIRMVSDFGLDGLDTTVYWFPDTSDQYLANLRRTAYKNGVSLYNIGVRTRLAQPTPE